MLFIMQFPPSYFGNVLTCKLKVEYHCVVSVLLLVIGGGALGSQHWHSWSECITSNRWSDCLMHVLGLGTLTNVCLTWLPT